jgi:hypothetical protein
MFYRAVAVPAAKAEKKLAGKASSTIVRLAAEHAGEHRE